MGVPGRARNDVPFAAAQECAARSLVMIACLQEVDPVRADEIDDAMFLRQAAGPGSRGEELQRLRPPDPGKGLAHDGLDQIERPERDLAVRIDPVPKILAELWVKDGESSTSGAVATSSPSFQSRAPAAACRRIPLAAGALSLAPGPS